MTLPVSPSDFVMAASRPVPMAMSPPGRTLSTLLPPASRDFSAVKNGFDLSLVAISALLCLVNHTSFYGIGAGTVLSALLLGRVIRLYERLLPPGRQPRRHSAGSSPDDPSGGDTSPATPEGRRS